MDLGNGVEVNFGKFGPEQLQTAAAEIIEAAKARGVELSHFAGASIVKSAVSAEAEPVVDAFDQLSPEQQEKATRVTAALAEKFGVSAEDFSVLRTTAEDGSDQFTVAYTASNGIDLGDPSKDYDAKRSWHSIFNKKADKDFIIEVEGKKIDVRTGMTEDVYRAFIADAKARDVNPLPDSPQLSEQNDPAWTATWLTGEEAGWENARIAGVNVGGQVSAGWDNRGDDYRGLRFRPAAVIS